MHPRTVLIGLIVLGAAFAEGSANDWIALATVDGHGVDKSTGALVLGLFVTAMTDRAARRRRAHRPVRPRARAARSFLLAAVGLLIFIFVPDRVGRVRRCRALGARSGARLPDGDVGRGRRSRHGRRRVSAVAGIGYFAFLVGPPVIGFVGEHHRRAARPARRARAASSSAWSSSRRGARDRRKGAKTDTTTDPMNAGLRLVVARCSVDYAGRLSAHLPLATRLLVVKADGSVLVHSDSLSYKPLNWMSPPCTLTVIQPDEEQADAGVTELWKVTQAKTADLLVISIHEVLHDSCHELGVDPGLQKDGVEAHLQKLLAEQIELLGDGHRLVRREYMTAIGPVDILATDADGRRSRSRSSAAATSTASSSSPATSS